MGQITANLTFKSKYGVVSHQKLRNSFVPLKTRDLENSLLNLHLRKIKGDCKVEINGTPPLKTSI